MRTHFYQSILSSPLSGRLVSHCQYEKQISQYLLYVQLSLCLIAAVWYIIVRCCLRSALLMTCKNSFPHKDHLHSDLRLSYPKGYVVIIFVFFLHTSNMKDGMVEENCSYMYIQTIFTVENVIRFVELPV